MLGAYMCLFAVIIQHSYISSITVTVRDVVRFIIFFLDSPTSVICHNTEIFTYFGTNHICSTYSEGKLRAKKLPLGILKLYLSIYLTPH